MEYFHWIRHTNSFYFGQYNEWVRNNFVKLKADLEKSVVRLDIWKDVQYEEMEEVRGERKRMIGDVMNVWNQNIQRAKITRAVSLPAVPRRHWGTRRGTGKCLECERMENNSDWIYPPEGGVPPVPTLCLFCQSVLCKESVEIAHFFKKKISWSPL